MYSGFDKTTKEEIIVLSHLQGMNKRYYNGQK